MTMGDPGRPRTDRLWQVPALLLVVGVTAARVWYVAVGCPFDLSPDEAHYWDWSRRPDWSYYSKGPLVAWLIGASTTLLGDTAFAVRLPAVVCGAALLVGLQVLAVRTLRSGATALIVVAVALTLPGLHAAGVVMTIDAPFACLWVWALVFGHEAAVGRRAWAWPVVGLLVGLGVLAKYTMLLWPASLVLFLLARHERRGVLAGPGIVWVVALTTVACLPIAWWNWQNGWVTFRHVGGQAGLTRSAASAVGPIGFLAEQAGLLLGFWFVAWAVAIGRGARVGTDASRAWLWWMSVPTFAAFAAASVLTRVQPNWPLAAYLSGLILATDLVRRALATASGWQWRTTAGGLAAASVAGLALSLALHDPTPLRPVLLSLAGPAVEHRHLPVRRLDPTCRLHGWKEVARAADAVCEDLRKNHCEPILAGANWTLPGELAFYCDKHPTVYSLGPGAGDRRSQYECWHPNPADDADVFRGRTFVLVSVGPPPDVVAAFDHIEQPQAVVHRVNGVAVAEFSVTVCRGFRGFPDAGVQERY